MKVVALYSFNSGEEQVKSHYRGELAEIYEVIEQVDAEKCKIKVSKEKTIIGKMLYSPADLNVAFAGQFLPRSWAKYRKSCDYSPGYYLPGYNSAVLKGRRPFREMDFVKNRLGVEVQFGKYSFMVYNVCAKMTIFHNLNVIDVGVEIVPVKEFAMEMSTGVSYFEQFTWDLDQRGVSNIDIPVLILGVTS